MPAKQSTRHLTEADKRRIVDYAIGTSLVTASRKYGFAVSTIGGWDAWKQRDKTTAVQQGSHTARNVPPSYAAAMDTAAAEDMSRSAEPVLPAAESIAKHFTIYGYEMTAELAECETQLEAIVGSAETELAATDPDVDVMVTLLRACLSEDPQRQTLIEALPQVPMEERMGSAFDKWEDWQNSVGGQAWEIVLQEFTAAVGENNLLEYAGDGHDNAWNVMCPEAPCEQCGGVMKNWRCAETLLRQRTEAIAAQNS